MEVGFRRITYGTINDSWMIFLFFEKKTFLDYYLSPPLNCKLLLLSLRLDLWSSRSGSIQWVPLVVNLTDLESEMLVLYSFTSHLTYKRF